MKVKIILASVLFLVILSISPKIYSQDQSDGHFYEINFLNIPYDKISEYNDLYESYGKPMDAQNEYILSVKVFRHFSGPIWNVCFITEYKDAESFVAAGKRGDEIFAKLIPDKSKRDEVMKKWMSFLTGHSDALVTDIPKFEKK